MEEDKLQIHMVITDKGYFITDTVKTSGYHSRYSKSKLESLLFDGQKPQETYVEKWYKVHQYPKSIQKQNPDSRVNELWVLRDMDMESKALPLERPYAEMDYEDSVFDLYKLAFDIVPGKLVDVPYDLHVITEVENFGLPPKIDYTVERKKGYSHTKVILNNTNVQHQLLDKLIIPTVILHEYPCKFSSKDMYDIVRYHVKKNIDDRYARITSDYNFCFTVKKMGHITGPGKINHRELAEGTFDTNIMVEEYREFEVFEMTHEEEDYKSYTPIKEFTANNQQELKEKVDRYLDELMKYINAPSAEYKKTRR